MSQLKAELDAGNGLFVDDEFEAALTHYDKACALSDGASDNGSEAFLKRASCLNKLSRHADALRDADQAISSEPANAVGHHNRAVALFGLKRYAEAHNSAKSAHKLLSESGSQQQHASLLHEINALMAQCADKLTLQKEAPEGEAHIVTRTDASHHVTAPSQAVSKVAEAVAAISPASPSAATASSSPSSAPPPRPKTDWYQSLTHVTVTVWVRSSVEAASSVMAAGHKLDVSITCADGAVHQLQFHLFDAIAPGAAIVVSYRPTKVEVKLPKATPAMWPALERPAGGGVVAGAISTAPTAAAQSFAAPATAASSLASRNNGSGVSSSSSSSAIASSMGGVPSAYASKRDWSSLERQLAKEAEEDEAAPEGEAALQALFQQIYAGGDEDTRKAMMKSFVSRRTGQPAV